MSKKNVKKAHAAFKSTKRPLKIWEEAARETAKKSERLKALRLAKEAADRKAEVSTADADKD